MATATSLSDIDNSACSRETYFHAVQIVLKKVFGFESWDAAHRVDELNRAMSNLSDDAKILFFHAEPFDIALDLATEHILQFSPDRIDVLRKNAAKVLKAEVPRAVSWNIGP